MSICLRKFLPLSKNFKTKTNKRTHCSYLAVGAKPQTQKPDPKTFQLLVGQALVQISPVYRATHNSLVSLDTLQVVN